MSAGSAARVLRLGTRGSALARRQTEQVAARIALAEPRREVLEHVFRTRGDDDVRSPIAEIGVKGVFTEALELALRDGTIDAAVHSLKDLPIEGPPGVVLGAICCREEVRDVLVSRAGVGLAALPGGAVVGTSSARRAAQLGAARPDLIARPIRGNVETRIEQVDAGVFDATILAAAGILRLGLGARISEWLPIESFLPAPGQGALAVQCRADDGLMLELLAGIDDEDARACTVAERAFLAGLGGGCSLPVGALAQVLVKPRLRLRGRVLSPAGTPFVDVDGSGETGFAHELGERLAQKARRLGAMELLT